MNNRGIIRQLVLEIVAMVLTISFTIPLWNRIDTSEESAIAKYYDNYYYVDYSVKDLNDVSHITLSNASNTNEEYNLVMKVKNNTNVDLKNISINVNGVEEIISNYRIISKGAYNYVLLDRSEIVANTTTYDIKVNDNKTLDYTFEVLETI